MSSAIPTHGRDAGVSQPHAVQVDQPGKVTGWVGRVALAGILAPISFFAIMMVLGLVTPDYDWIARYGSELSLGRFGWIMIANFIALGVVEIALAAALGRTVGNRVSGWVATGALGLLGAAFVVAGICVTDPATL